MESEKFLLWKQRLEDIKQSDLTVDEWCTKNQVSKHAYVKYYYGEVGEKNEAICSSYAWNQQGYKTKSSNNDFNS